MSTSRLLEALVDDLMTEYLDSIADRLPDMAREFQDSGFIAVPNFAARVLWPHVRQEVYDLLETRGRRRDLQVAVTGNSPRS